MPGFVAFVLTLAGASSVYLGSRHQRWLRAPLSYKLAFPLGALLLLAGLACWTFAAQPLTGTFIFLVQLMLLWVLFPFIGIFTRSRQ